MQVPPNGMAHLLASKLSDAILLSCWENQCEIKLHDMAKQLHEIEKLFQKCVQRDLNYKLNTNFVTRCQLFAEKNVSR